RTVIEAGRADVEERKVTERAKTLGVTAQKDSSPAQLKAATPPRLWDPNGGPPTFVVLKGHRDQVFFAAFSPDGTHVVTASNDKTARVWDLREKQPSFIALEGHQSVVGS